MAKRMPMRIAAWVILLLTAGAGGTHASSISSASTPALPDTPIAGLATADSTAAILERLTNNQPVELLVVFNVEAAAADAAPAAAAAPEGSPSAKAAAAPTLAVAARGARLAAQAAAKERVLLRAIRASSQGVTLSQDYAQLPISLVTVSSLEAFQALQAHPLVTAVAPNGKMWLARLGLAPETEVQRQQELEGQPWQTPEMLQRRGRKLLLRESLPLISQPQAVANGFTGDGCTVAVLDTGADYNQKDLGPCTAPGVPANKCRVWVSRDFTAAGDDGQLDDYGHGTNVASIIARVAPAARIMALDIFTYDPANGDFYALFSDIIDAVNFAVAQKYEGGINVCAINLSVGGGDAPFENTCESQPVAVALSEARGAGILSAVAAGNDGWSDGLKTPACAPAAVSVGAVYDSNFRQCDWSACSDNTTAADQIACFSDSAYYLTLLAPGAFITAGGLTLAGTSQATPHVAGALAALMAAVPDASPDEVLQALQDTGRPVIDPRNGLIFPRINIAAAGVALKAAPPAEDAAPPNATVKVDGGAAWVTSGSVTLTIQCRDASGCAEMCISNFEVSECAPFERYTGTKRWQLTEGDGPKSVYVILRDRRNNIMPAPALASVTLDSRRPTGAGIVIDGGAEWTDSRNVTLALTGYDENELLMCLSNELGPSPCYPYERFAASKQWLLSRGDGDKAVTLYLRDKAGNEADPVRAGIALDGEGPSNVTVMINDGAEWTPATNVTLTITTTDYAGIAGMCISNIGPCTDFVPFVNVTPWTLSEGPEGCRTVYMMLRDSRGRLSAAPANASIVLDGSPPSGVAVIINNGASRLTTQRNVLLSINATDYSGVATACISNSPGPCTAFELYSSIQGTRVPWTLDGDGDGPRTVYVTLRDWRSNTIPRPAQAMITLDVEPPRNTSVALESGATATNTRQVMLSLGAYDVSGVAGVCMTESLTVSASGCMPWEPFSARKAFNLSSPEGPKTLRAFFKDGVGHVTEYSAMTDLVYDVTSPAMVAKKVAFKGFAPSKDSVTLQWNKVASDRGFFGSGVSNDWVVAYRKGAPPCAKCACASPGRQGAGGAAGFQSTKLVDAGAGTAVVSGLAPKTRYKFRLCAQDNAGNRANGVVMSVVTRP